MKPNIKLKISVGRLFFLVLLLLIVVLGGTFAWFTFRSNKAALVLTVGDINKTQVTIRPYQLRINSIPSTQYDNDVYSDVIVTNNDDNATTISLTYKSSVRCTNANDSNCQSKISNYPSNLINYKIVRKTTSNYNEEVIPDASNTIKSGTINPSTGTVNIYSSSVSANQKAYYRIYVWADGTTGNTSNVQGTEVSLELNAAISS